MKETPSKTRPAREKTTIGWREVISLPELGISDVVAKIDTGARTSAIHATHVVPFVREGADWVRFHIPHSSGLRARDVEAPLLGERPIKNTSGIHEDRLVIETALVLGRRRWRIEVSLANRTRMALPIILGRTAIRRHKMLVDPGRSFLLGKPPHGAAQKRASAAETSDS
ncbi:MULTISPECIES: ATP-dependent zinc protease family protein [Sediminimonas]|uniref:ATP-dependent zinc protease n=1 Tax=Sediminimonas qiaohouensis TaxID=552061 RepID=A0A7C9HBK7_9RHOB|nr:MULTISPECIES: RimK/LysX family protein [Sediminimonas]MDR9484301.1 RimK/LysX family protein [Sediminimonas sp.]MTJ05349.1 ATP-dependent zinc protease [Sediminimonas qiaohouensis]